MNEEKQYRISLEGFYKNISALYAKPNSNTSSIFRSVVNKVIVWNIGEHPPSNEISFIRLPFNLTFIVSVNFQNM